MNANSDQPNAPLGHADPDVDAVATPDELAAAAELRDADYSRTFANDELTQLVQAVRAAASDGVLDEFVHNALIEHALDTIDGDVGTPTAMDAEAWQLALRAAHTQHEVSADALDAILASTLGPHVPVAASPSAAVPASTSATVPHAALVPLPPSRATANAPAQQERGLAQVLTFVRPHRMAAAVAAIAAAACLGVWLRGETAPKAAYAPALISVHSTAPLFDAPFETHGTSARIDRMAAARRTELRENRFRAWGLK
jgi:hypothetical protein